MCGLALDHEDVFLWNCSCSSCCTIPNVEALFSQPIHNSSLLYPITCSMSFSHACSDGWECLAVTLLLAMCWKHPCLLRLMEPKQSLPMQMTMVIEWRNCLLSVDCLYWRLCCLFVDVPDYEAVFDVTDINLREFIANSSSSALSARLRAMWNTEDSTTAPFSVWITKVESYADRGRRFPLPPRREG